MTDLMESFDRVSQSSLIDMFKIKLPLLFSFMILLGAGCASQSSLTPTNMSERIILTTSDGVEIVADFYPAGGDKFAILLHMMPATKESWQEFASALQEKGISSIAIDERGHGESQDGPNGFKEFTDAEQAAKILDVRAAWEELVGRGASSENTVVVGASIGANLAIAYVDEMEKIPAGVALSPGLDYRSVTTLESVASGLGKNQKILLVASEEDEYAYLSIEKLHQANKKQTEFWPQSNLGHGTTMFENDPDLMQKVIEWIENQL